MTRAGLLLALCAAAARAYAVRLRPCPPRVRAQCLFGSGGVEEIVKNQWCMKVESAEQLSVVFFYAPWCRSCKAVGPVYKRLAREIKDVNFFKVNFNQETQLCYQVKIAQLHRRQSPAMLLTFPVRCRSEYFRFPLHIFTCPRSVASPAVCSHQATQSRSSAQKSHAYCKTGRSRSS